jgi:glycosyltransferase A (GT-A) superfamily protein (DUF2064 family)
MRPRAVVLFARSPWREAAAKGLRGETAALFRRLISSWMRAAGSAQLIVACEEIDRAALNGIEPSIDRITLVQRGATFGERLANATDDAFAFGCDRVIVAGIDAPPPDLERVFDLLDEHDVVAAPATDGGVNVIALAAPAHELLASIEIGRRCIDIFAGAAILDRVTDIDSPRDLARASRELAWSGYFDQPEPETPYSIASQSGAPSPASSRAPPMRLS